MAFQDNYMEGQTFKILNDGNVLSDQDTKYHITSPVEMDLDAHVKTTISCKCEPGYTFDK